MTQLIILKWESEHETHQTIHTGVQMSEPKDLYQSFQIYPKM